MCDDASQAVMISLRPEYSERVAAGSKTVELRRRFPEVPSGTTIVIYTTMPVGALTGVVRVARIDRDSPDGLWTRHGPETGVSKDQFFDYFDGCDMGCAVVLSGYEELDEVPMARVSDYWPSFRPPQSYRYVPAAVVARLRARSREQDDPSEINM